MSSDVEKQALRPEQEMTTGIARRTGIELGILALCFLATVATTFPYVLHTFDLTGPDNRSQMLWNFWWAREALLHRHCDPFYTPMLFHPEGAGLAFHTFSLFSCIAFLPLSLLAPGIYGPLLAYRVQILAALALSCYCTYRLVVSLTGSRRAGFIAGSFFTFRSFHFAHYTYPHINSTYWMPLYAMTLMWLVSPTGKCGRWRVLWRAAVSASVFACATYTSTEYALFLFCFAAVFVSWHLVARPKAWRETIGRSCLSYGLAAILIAPLLASMHRERQSGSLYKPPMGQDVKFSADLVSHVLPGGSHFLLGRLTGELEAKVNHHVKGNDVFLGYAGLCLFVASVLVLKRQVWSVWFLAAVVFFLLSLGPYLHIGGHTYRSVWLPYLFFKKLPLMGLFRTPIRFHTMFLFPAAVVIGLGCAAALRSEAARRARKQTVRVVYVIIAILVTFECKYEITSASPNAPARIPRVYDFIASQPGDFAIAELPTSYLNDRQYMAYQTVHGKKLFNGSLSRKPRVTNDLSEPYEQGFKYILVHERFYYSPNDFYRQCAAMERFADFLWMQDGVAVYEVRRP